MVHNMVVSRWGIDCRGAVKHTGGFGNGYRREGYYFMSEAGGESVL